MAAIQVKRSIPSAQPKRRRLNPRLKHRLYETLYDLNRGFFLTLECFERLERLAFFRRDYLRAFHNMADELRARTNYELTETLRDREQRESAQFGRLRVKWERRFTSPGDTTLKRKSDDLPLSFRGAFRDRVLLFSFRLWYLRIEKSIETGPRYCDT